MMHADATGNTFLMVDQSVPKSQRVDWIKQQQVSEDGVIWVDPAEEGFTIDYYNRDGSNAALCGNGTRSSLCYLLRLGLIRANEWVALFTGSGKLQGLALSAEEAMVAMPNPCMIASVRWQENQGVAVMVGVPHVVFQAESKEAWKRWDLQKAFQEMSRLSVLPQGANINCCYFEQGVLFNRTFERGVEAETLSCGTGCVAAVWAMKEILSHGLLPTKVQTQGGMLEVFIKQQNYYLKGKVILNELV